MFLKLFIKSQALAEICRNIAEVFFASVFISSIFGSNISTQAGFWGIFLAFIFWAGSLYLEKE
jgi:hypothetical protein